MQWILLPPILYVAAVVQTTLADSLRLGQIEPDCLLLAGLVWLIYARGNYRFLGLGAMGLVGDLIGTGRLGPGCAAGLVVGYLIVRFDRKLRLELPLVQAALAGAAAILMILLDVFLRGLLGEFGTLGCFATALGQAFGSGLYTAAAGLFTLLLIGRLPPARRVWRRRRAEWF